MGKLDWISSQDFSFRGHKPDKGDYDILPFAAVAGEQVFVVLRIKEAGTQRAAKSGVLMLDTVLTQQAGVVPLAAGSCPTLDTYSAVL